MKESIHAEEEQKISGVGLLGVEKMPMVLGKLHRIKNKQLVMSVMNNEEGFGLGIWGGKAREKQIETR